MDIQSIIFDYGGVLGIPDHMAACRALSKYSKYSEKELYSLIFDNDIEKIHECGEINSKSFWNAVRHHFNENLTYSKFFKFWGDINFPNADIEIVLQGTIPNISKFILSNTEDIHWHFISKMAIINKYFPYKFQHILSFELGYRKPSKEIFLKAINRIGKKPNNIVFVDDNLSFVEAFMSLGGNAIHYNCKLNKIDILKNALSNYRILQ